MEIRRLSLAAGAKAATGLAVIIDVFRSFSSEPLLIHLGTARLLLENDVERCFARRGDALLVGSRNEQPVPGFDMTNSPYRILQAGEQFFRGRTVIHRSTSGVGGVPAALAQADEVLLASFINARATAAYIRQRNPATVSLVAMGSRATIEAPEDERCADYLENLLTGKPYDHIAALVEILAHHNARKYLDADNPHLPKEDIILCLQRDLVDFALRAERRDEMIEAIPIPTT
ncbi:MAG: 2-phosphosulfolactate phosphatase [Candidatus Competibacteraceae bacterium]|nr:2-phosphosulfolactate phosphatase [Candidatus Competibacteraceae bacterium]